MANIDDFIRSIALTMIIQYSVGFSRPFVNKVDDNIN
jgi:hypothetical protein